MTNDDVRKSISAILAEIEASPMQIHDDDAAEAWEIIDRIEHRLFPAGMPR